MSPSFNLSESGLYYVPPAGDHAAYMAFIDALPVRRLAAHGSDSNTLVGASTYGDAKKVANRNVGDFGWEIAHAAVSRRPPNSLDRVVARTRTTRTPREFGICPSFKGHSLSRRAKP